MPPKSLKLVLQEITVFPTVDGLFSKLQVSPFILPFFPLIVSPFNVLNRTVYTVCLVGKRYRLVY